MKKIIALCSMIVALGFFTVGCKKDDAPAAPASGGDAATTDAGADTGNGDGDGDTGGGDDE